MSLQLKISLLILLFIVFVALVMQVKKKKLELQYTLSWLLLLSILVIVILFPGLLSFITSLAGVSLPINMIFFLGFCFSLLIIYHLTKAVSKLSGEIKSLCQRIAILESTLNKKRKSE